MSAVVSISQTVVNNFATVAFVTVLLYDWALTIPAEIEYIWKQKFNFGKFLFLLNRYLPIIDLFILMNSYTNRAIHGRRFCVVWFHVDSWVGIFSILVIDLMLLLRTWALWRRSRAILLSLGFLMFVCFIAEAGATLYASIVVVVASSPLENIRPCQSDFAHPEVLYAIWVGLIVYDTAVVLLTLMRAIPPTRLLKGGAPVIEAFLRDGIQYFILISLTAIANIILINVAPPPLTTMLFTLHRVTNAVLGSRMVLNLRGTLLQARSEDSGSSMELSTLPPSVQPLGMTTYFSSSRHSEANSECLDS